MSIVQAWQPCRVSSCNLGCIFLYSILINSSASTVFFLKKSNSRKVYMYPVFGMLSGKSVKNLLSYKYATGNALT
jgi:hypothetical protein